MSHPRASGSNHIHRKENGRNHDAASVSAPKRRALPAISTHFNAIPSTAPRRLPRIPSNRRESQEPLIRGAIGTAPHPYGASETSALEEEDGETEPAGVDSAVSIPTPASSSLSPNRAPKVVYFSEIPGRRLSFTPYDPRGIDKPPAAAARRRAWKRDIQKRLRRALRELRRFLERS